jgi:siroheme synthase-like protein
MNFSYPVFLDVTGKRCLVTGAGPEIASKVGTLVDRGADVIYVSANADACIIELAEKGRLEWRARDFEEGDLEGCFLVITAGADNASIFKLAEARGILCNAADDPDHCRFTFGSVVRRGDLAIAISTNGAAPALAVRLREKLEREIGPEYGTFVAMLSEIRDEIGASTGDFESRRRLWYRIVDSEALELVRQGRLTEAKQLLRGMIEAAR